MNTNDYAATDSFAECLTLIKSNKWASVEDLARWSGSHPATVYAWIAGTASPSIESPRLIVQNCGESLHANRIRLQIGAWMFAGTGVTCRGCTPATMATTPEAIKDGLLHALHDLADFAQKAQTALADGIICLKDRTLLQSEAEEARTMIDRVLHAITLKSEADVRGGIPRLGIAK